MAKIIDSENCDQPGILSKIDRLCRKILPGYNYIRNRHSGSRDSQEARRVCSGFSIPSKFRGNRGKNRDPAEITDEIYLGAGISKSEFCQELEELLRKKLIVMQERMKQVDLEELSWEADQKPDYDDESLGVRPLVSPEVRQRMIQAMIHQSSQDPTDTLDNLQEIANQKTHKDEQHPSIMEQKRKVPSDDIKLKENEVEEPESETETQPERVPTPNSLLDYFLS